MSRPIPPHLQGAGAPVPPPNRSARRTSATAPPVARSRDARERIRLTIRGIGEILITLGLVLLLFCAYQLWWTDVTSTTATNAAAKQLTQTFAETPLRTDKNGPIPPLTGLQAGEPFARMYVPRFGSGWVRPIIQGVTLGDLHKGVGHYPKSALPGELGNFAVAGHRTTNGHPFRNIDKLNVGDQVFVETKDAWYTYTVYQARLTVKPEDVYVVAPVPAPNQGGAVPTERLMTMTSCHPPYSASQRMVVHLKLSAKRPRGDGPPPGAPSSAT